VLKIPALVFTKIPLHGVEVADCMIIGLVAVPIAIRVPSIVSPEEKFNVTPGSIVSVWPAGTTMLEVTFIVDPAGMSPAQSPPVSQPAEKLGGVGVAVAIGVSVGVAVGARVGVGVGIGTITPIDRETVLLRKPLSSRHVRLRLPASDTSHVKLVPVLIKVPL
jgi:hypothetical protein